jgi:hypothetical protein
MMNTITAICFNDLKPLVTIRYCCFYSIGEDLPAVVTDHPAITFRFGIDHSHHCL